MTLLVDRVVTRSELAGGPEQGSSTSAGLPEAPVEAGGIGRSDEDQFDWLENRARGRNRANRLDLLALAGLSLLSAAGIAGVAAVAFMAT